MHTEVSRRRFFGLGVGAAAATSLGAFPLTADAQSATAHTSPASFLRDAASYEASIEKAVGFQNTMMDAYAAGSTVRLTQSYSDQALGATAFTYDNAVSIHAYLIRGDQDSVTRAQILGKGLIAAQTSNFPFNDGRFAQAYFVNVAGPDGSFITPAAAPFYFYSSTVGDQAWAGMALAQLYHRTADPAYLIAALKVANWIVTNAYNTLGAGGYSFGTTINQYNQSVPSTNGKSTEHNIDAYAFFTMLTLLSNHGKAANGTTWKRLAEHALTFVKAMFNDTGGYFYTGTLGDQITINPTPIPEDVQTWSYLALLDKRYKHTIDWALANLQATDSANAVNSSLTGAKQYTGMVFDTASLTTTATGDDPHAVWLEGTAHTIAALIARVLTGGDTLLALLRDITAALSFLANAQRAQAQLGAGQTVNGKLIPLGEGLVAATSVMDTGFGYTYGPSLHIVATGWYLIAALGGNPFQLGYNSVVR